MGNLNLAIIIPTLNEQLFIGNLLDSIYAQSGQPREIVIIDANSKDKTIEEVKKRQKILPQLKYFRIPRYTISRQRNLGAAKTSAENILFLDADIELRDPQTLEKYINEVKEKNPDIAAARNYPLESNWQDKFFYGLIYIVYQIIKPFWPAADGRNIFIKRKVFNKVGGFDDQLLVGEDHKLVQDVVNSGGKFIFVKNPKIYSSSRRFHREGRVNFTIKIIKSFFYVTRKGYRGNPMEYEFGNFK
ncbi:glycosyltransferase [Candidatus Daviesbacteria bacterium]|nr:glycosyltransferase [Candidatus Daviesbacteria bacterium]